MKLPIKYQNLRAGDIVFTGGVTPFSSLIRLVTGGKFRSIKSTATHVGILIEFHGQLLLAEMLKDGLSISSLEEYRKSKRRFIITVGRVTGLLHTDKTKIQKRIAYDRRKTIEYDFKGILSFLFNVKDVPEKYYCSEYVFSLLDYVHRAPIMLNKTEQISPEDLHHLFFESGYGTTVVFE